MSKYFIFLLLLICNQCVATKRYVASAADGGSYSNPGTLASPYLTISKVGSISLSAGDSIYFNCGDTIFGKLDKSTNNLFFSSYGTGAMPVLVYSGADAERNRNVFHLTGSNIKITGLNFTYPTQDADRNVVAYTSIAVLFEGGNNNQVTFCNFSKVGTGIFFKGGSGNNFCTFCNFNDMRTIRNDVGGDNDYGANGILMSDVNNCLITYCTFDSCAAPSLDYIYDGGALEFFGACSHNRILYCTMTFCDGVAENGSSAAGTSTGNEVSYCKITNCGELTYTSASGGFPVQVDSMHYWNCVIIDTVNFKGAAACFNYSGSETSSAVFDIRNCIFYLKGGINVVTGGDDAKTYRANNAYHMSGGSSVGYSIGPGESSINIFSTLVNVPAGDYHLLPGCSVEGKAVKIPGLTDVGFDGAPIENNLGVYGPGRYDQLVNPVFVN